MIFENDFCYITPNKRLSAFLRRQHDQAQQQSHSSWPTLRVLPYETWLIQCFENTCLAHDLQLLSDMEMLLLFEKSIEHTHEKWPLLCAPATLLKEAYERLKEWRLSVPDDSAITPEVQMAKEWIAHYLATCKKRKLIDLTDVVDLILPHISGHAFAFVGFNEFTPLQLHLMEQLKKQNNRVEICALSYTHHPHITTYEFIENTHELQTMVAWAYAQAQKGLRVACVLPDLRAQRTMLETLFKKTVRDSTVFFNISSGKALNDYPLIAIALACLSLHTQPTPEIISEILCSPFISSDLARFNIDTKVREQRECTLDDLVKLSAQTSLHTALLAFKNILIPAKNSFAQWVTLFSHALKIIGWPGERTLNSLEYQTLMQFNESLQLLTLLDRFHPPVNYETALQYLKKYCKNTVFQGQSLGENIQILGALEAAGLEFDAMWIMGLTAHAWPAAAKPNPFLPILLQRAHQMPHASAERELQFTAHLTEQLLQSAGEIILSYAHEHHQQRISPFIADQCITPYPYTLKPTAATAPLETLHDTQGPALSDKIFKRGLSALSLQASCPFKAFATERLAATKLAKTAALIEKKDRGIMLHHALEIIWTTLKNQKNLLAHSETELEQLIEKSLETASSALNTTPELKKLELMRSAVLLKQWLAYEKTRPDFNVLAVEKIQTYSFCGKEISVRLDRIDVLNDHTHLLIDYKTRKNSLSDWEDERPLAPQLPFYALHEKSVSALAYAQLTPIDPKLVGFSAENIGISSIKKHEDWAALNTTWQIELEKLTHAFIVGDARVDPKTSQSCELCDLHSLCRIHEKENVHE